MKYVCGLDPLGRPVVVAFDDRFSHLEMGKAMRRCGVVADSAGFTTADADGRVCADPDKTSESTGLRPSVERDTRALRDLLGGATTSRLDRENLEAFALIERRKGVRLVFDFLEKTGKKMPEAARALLERAVLGEDFPGG